jgi:hypothetical protein
MAIPAFPSNDLLGIIAADDWAVASITELYIYADGISRGEMARLVGWRDKDGAITDGVLADKFNALTSKGADLDAVTVEEDVDASSPHNGRLRINIPVVALV